MLSTATKTAEPARSASKGREALGQTKQQELFPDGADDLDGPIDDELIGDIRLATDDLEFDSLSDEMVNGGLIPDIAAEATLLLAPEGAVSEPSPVWTLLRKVKPLPTADGTALIEIDPSPEERQAMEALWNSAAGGV